MTDISRFKKSESFKTMIVMNAYKLNAFEKQVLSMLYGIGRNALSVEATASCMCRKVKTIVTVHKTAIDKIYDPRRSAESAEEN